MDGDPVNGPGPALLEVDGIQLRFGGVMAINDVSLTVHTGELFAIIGPNGAGKTSIFNSISQVYIPQVGDVRWKGESIKGYRPDKVAELGIARTFQNIELFPQMTVLDNLLLGRHVRMKRSFLAGALWWGPTRREELENRRQVEDIVDFLEIEQWRKHPVALLPYGIQKRVELGRALAMEPQLLMLDEPVAGMNLEETEDMARFILDIRQELGIAMLLVEHDMGLVMDIADRVLVLDFGVKISEGTPAEVQRDPAVIAAYLGDEQQLLAAAPEVAAVAAKTAESPLDLPDTADADTSGPDTSADTIPADTIPAVAASPAPSSDDAPSPTPLVAPPEPNR